MGKTWAERKTEYVSRHRRHSLWQRIVGFLALAVLCGTVYALILPAVAVSSGTDITDTVSEVTLYKNNGVVWEETTSFAATDDAKLKLAFAVDSAVLLGAERDEADNSVLTYILLPEAVSIPSEMFGEEQAVELYDSNYTQGPSAVYYLEDGKACVRFTEGYLEFLATSDVQTVDGTISLEFNWDEEKLSDGYNTCTDFFGEKVGTVYIYKEETETDTETGGDTETSVINYIWKGASSPEPVSAEESLDGYITYTITMKFDEDVPGPITLKDTLIASGNTQAEYVDGTISASYSWQNINVPATWENTDGETSATITLGDENTTFEAGTEYKITYTVLVKDLYNSEYSESDIGNKATLTIGDESKSATAWVTTSRSKATKNGSDQGEGVIDWTVYINAGSVKSYLKDVVFTDQLTTAESTAVNEDSIKITQYDLEGNSQEYTLEKFIETFGVGSSFDKDTQKLTLALPDGMYYYKVTYKTETDIGGITDGTSVEVKNSYGLTGYGSGFSDSESVWVKKDNISKTLTKTGGYKTVDGKWVAPLTYTIAIKEAKANTTYYDYTNNSEILDTVAWEITGYNELYYMTEEQFAAITVTYADGTAVDASDYVITKYNEDDEAKYGLFQIDFLQDISGPIYINYTVYADFSNVSADEYKTFTNYFGNDERWVSTSTWLQNKGANGWIYKYTSGSKAGDFSSEYSSGIKDSIDWIIAVNKNWDVTGDLVITDTIPAGLSVDMDSIKLLLDQETINPSSDNNMDKEKYTVSCEKNDDGTQTLTIKVQGDAYLYAWSNVSTRPFYVLYTTEITDQEYLKGSELKKVFENTAVLERTDGTTDENTHEVTVSRGVTGKGGGFDPSTNTLNYEVVVNPDSSDLLNNGEGGQLYVEDTLIDLNAALQGNLKLIGVSLFYPVKDSDGIITAGTKVRDLEYTDSLEKAKSENDIYYYYNKENYDIGVYLSDDKGYVLVYFYLVTTDQIASTVAVTNKVTIYGEDQAIDSVEITSKVLKYSMSGALHTDTDKTSITVRKHDSELYATLLGGASYVLQYYQDGSWVTNGVYTTDEDSGTRQIAGLSYDMLYCLTEIKAPEGYELDNAPFYFVIRSDTEQGAGDVPVPEGLTYKEYTDSGTTVFVELTDEKDETYNPDDSTTSITVKKKWSASTDISAIYFDLYQAAAGSETLTGTEWWDSENDASTLYTIADGDTIVFTMKYKNNITAPNVTLELSDGNVWIDSNLGSQTNAWFFPTDENANGYKVEGNITNTSYTTDAEGNAILSPDYEDFTLEKGHKYTATVTRNGNKFTIVYRDETADEYLYTVTAEPTNLNMADETTVKIMAQRGVYVVSAEALDANGNATDIKIAEGSYYGTYKITAADNWTLTIDDLPATVAGSNGSTVCAYYVKEAGISGYTASYSENNDQGISSGTITITNTADEEEPGPDVPESETTDITVKKKWISSVTQEEVDPANAEMSFDLYQKETVVKDNGGGGEGTEQPPEEAKLTYVIYAKSGTKLESGEISGLVGDAICFTYTNNYASDYYSDNWSAAYVLPKEVKYNDAVITENNTIYSLAGTEKSRQYTVTLAADTNSLVFRTDLNDGETNAYTLTYEGGVAASEGSGNTSSGDGSEEPGEPAITVSGETCTGAGWWAGTKTTPVTLADNSTVTYTFSYDKVAAGANLTFEVTDGAVYVDANLGATWNNAWSSYDTSGAAVISDCSSFSFVQGHVYEAKITRNGKIYTFAYKDLTDDEECYTTNVITASDLGNTEVYVLVQVGTYTFGEAGIEPDTLEVAADSGVAKIGSYTIGSSENDWSKTISQLPAKATDEDGNTIVYTYYVLETKSTNTASFISSWSNYANNDGVYDGIITITNTVGEYTEDVTTDLTVNKEWLTSNGGPATGNNVSESVSFYLYKLENAAKELASMEDDFNLECSTFWTAFSQSFELSEEPLALHVTTKSNGTSNWENLLYVIYNSADAKVYNAGTEGYTEYYVGRADNFGWGSGQITETTFAEGFDWAAWFAATQKGAEVTITAYLDGDNAIVTLECAGVTYTTTTPVDIAKPVYLALTGENCTLSDLTVNGAAALFQAQDKPDYTTKQTESYSLADEETVQFTVLYNGYTSLTALDPYIIVRAEGTVGQDTEYMDNIVDGFEKGHSYTVIVTRKGNDYTFTCSDAASGEQKYQKTVTANKEYDSVEASIIVQKGTYTISGSNLSSSGQSGAAEGTLYNQEPYTITSEGGWTTTISNLPAQGTDRDGNPVIYSYYVEETTDFEGYSASYTYGEGARNSAVAGSITITNKEDVPDDSEYELPQTGGSGTTKWYTFGAALTAIAMALLLYKKKSMQKGGAGNP